MMKLRYVVYIILGLLATIAGLSFMLWFVHGHWLVQRAAPVPTVRFIDLQKGENFPRTDYGLYSARPTTLSTPASDKVRWINKKKGEVHLTTDLAAELYLQKGAHGETSTSSDDGPVTGDPRPSPIR